MEKEAIDRIRELEASAVSHLPDDLVVPVIVLPGETTVHDLEKYLTRPVRMRRQFLTERLPDFCDYVENQSDDAKTLAIFIRPDSSGATAVIDYGFHDEPGWGTHQAHLTMKHTPEFEALNAVCSNHASQQTLIDFIEDWGDIITATSNDDGEIPIQKAIVAIRHIKIDKTASATHSQGDLKASRTAMEEIDASGAEGRKIPSRFTVKCAMFPDTKIQEFNVRMALLTNHSSPMFQLRVMGRDSVMQAVRDEIAAFIRERLKEATKSIYIGSTK